MNNDLCVISMSAFGMKTFIGTTQFEIDMLTHELSKNSDDFFGDSIDEDAFYFQLLSAVRSEDAFFDSIIGQREAGGERWNTFMSDCLLLAVLADLLGKERLRHMDQYKSFQEIADEVDAYNDIPFDKRAVSSAISKYFH